MKTTVLSGMLLGCIATAALAATCLPIIGNNVTVDGIVVGADVGVGGQVPPGCPTNQADKGWAGVLGQDIPVATGTSGTKKATLFLATHQGGGPSMDKIYLGVHVENTPDFTINDKLTVYFQADASKSDWDATSDFALVFDGIGPSAGTPSNDACTNPGGQVRYYKRDAGNTTWVPQASVPAGITFKTSYDYEQIHDPEWQLWELEVGIDVSSLNIVKGVQVGLGAKLYLFEAGVQATTAYHYPSMLTPVADSGLDFNPNQGSVTPATLDKVTVGNCTFDVIISTIQGADNNGNPGQFTVLNPNSSADFDQTTGAAKRQNQFAANVKFVNPANLSDTNPVAVPNAGNVAFRLKPWNGGFTDDITMANPTESFNQLGQPMPISIKWPANKAQWRTTLNGPGHACFIVDLSGFTVDLPNGNEMQQNLTYVSASTINTSFLIAAPREVYGAPGTGPGSDGRFEYILRAHWDNLPPKFLTGSNPFKYQITNAAALGMKSLGNGYYALRLKPGEQKRVMLKITGGRMPHPNVQFKLPATAGGQLLQPASGGPPLQIPAKPGAMVSILSRGKISVEKHPPSDANGYTDREQPNGNFLLHRGFYRPEEHVGAVIGSCDKFRTSFVVGTDSTFAVPESCETLLLAVNDIAGRYSDNKGVFEVDVMVGDPILLPTRLAARGSAANAQFGVPAQMQPGGIFPQLVVDVGQRFNRAKFNQLISTGYVAYAVYDSHPGK